MLIFIYRNCIIFTGRIEWFRFFFIVSAYLSDMIFFVSLK